MGTRYGILLARYLKFMRARPARPRQAQYELITAMRILALLTKARAVSVLFLIHLASCPRPTRCNPAPGALWPVYALENQRHEESCPR